MKNIAIATVVALSAVLTGCAGAQHGTRAQHHRADAMVDDSVDAEHDRAREIAREYLSETGEAVGFRHVRTTVPHEGRRHEGSVALLVTEGEGRLAVGTSTFRVTRGSVVTVPAGTLYGAEDEIEVVVISRSASMADLTDARPTRTAIAW